MSHKPKYSLEEFFRTPTDEELKELSRRNWEAVQPVLLTSLPLEIRGMTMKTQCVDIRTSDIIAHWLPRFDTVPEGADDIAGHCLVKHARDALKTFPNGFFFKLDSRSAKDTGITKYTKDNYYNIVGNFFNSERMLDDLARQRFHRESFTLCFREWVELENEQRVFVKEGAIQGVSRYDYTTRVMRMHADEIYYIMRDAQEMFDLIRPHMKLQSYVFDFGYVNGEPFLIELNPYGLSDPCCFGAYTNIKGYAFDKAAGHTLQPLKSNPNYLMALPKISDSQSSAHPLNASSIDEAIILRQPVLELLGEIDCRIEHGAESGGHLEYVRKELRKILGRE